MIVIIVIAVLLLIYVVFNLIKNRLYYPGLTYGGTMKKPSGKIKDLWLGNKTDKLHAWLHHIPGKPIILFCHGNGGNISNRNHYLKDMIKKKMSFLIFDYRGYGQSKGWTYMDSTYKDAVVCYKYLRDKYDEDIIPLGESIGGYPASRLASEHQTKKLILLTALNSISSVISKIPYMSLLSWFTKGDLDVSSYLQKYTGKALIMHSQDDEVVCFENAEKNYKLCKDAQLVKIGGTHNNTEFNWKTIENFIFT